MNYTLASSGSGSGGAIPAGIVVTWTGSVTNIPSGWALCDGTNGTPDLRNRFIVGAGTDSGAGYVPSTTETGSGIFKVADHGGQGMHQLTVAEMPSHNHSYSTPAGATLTQGGTLWYPNDSAVWPPTGNTGNTGGDQAHNNMPPYYALCYIMKL